MANCTNCGKKLSAGEKFCPSCGTAVKSSSKKSSSKKSPSKKTAAKGGSSVVERKANANDAQSNKVMAIIAYIGILCLIPLLTGDYKKSPFLKFHTNQGVVLFITVIAGNIASWILGIIFGAIRLWALISLVSMVVWLGIGILIILGVINAANGKMKPLPVIGNFTIIK